MDKKDADRDACIAAMTELGRIYVRGFSDQYDFPIIRRIVAAYRKCAPAEAA